MPSDPIYATIPAQLATSTSVVAQLDTTTTAWPWLVKAGASPTDLSTRLVLLAADLRARVSLASALDDSDKAAYLEAKPTLDKVTWWRRILRQRLRWADLGGPLAQAAAAEVRETLKLSPLRLQGTLVMLPRAVAALERTQPNLPEEVHAAESAAEGEALFAELLRCDGLRRTHDLDAAAAHLAVKAARAALIAHLRRIRWMWRLARDLSGGTIPKLNLSAGKADIA